MKIWANELTDTHKDFQEISQFVNLYKNNT